MRQSNSLTEELPTALAPCPQCSSLKTVALVCPYSAASHGTAQCSRCEAVFSFLADEIASFSIANRAAAALPPASSTAFNSRYAPMQRYQWQTPSAQQNTVPGTPVGHQLFDSVTGQPVIVIRETELGWKWERKTNYLLHRAHPAAGIEATLQEAQAAAVKDLQLEE